MGYSALIRKLAGQGVQFDMIYLDPPFEHGIEKEAMKLIIENRLMKDDGIMIVETVKTDEVSVEKPYYVEKTAVYGKNRITYVRKEH